MKKAVNIVLWIGTTVNLVLFMWTMRLFPTYSALERGWKRSYAALSGWLYQNGHFVDILIWFALMFIIIMSIVVVREGESKLS